MTLFNHIHTLLYSSHEQQVERLQKRDSLSEEEALQRIRAQMPLEEKCRKADLVLDNSGGIGLLENLVKDLYAELNRITYDQRMLRAFLVFLITVCIMYVLITSLRFLY